MSQPNGYDDNGNPIAYSVSNGKPERKWILIPKSYQPDSKDSREECGMEYVKYYSQAAVEELEREVESLKMRLAEAIEAINFAHERGDDWQNCMIAESERCQALEAKLQLAVEAIRLIVSQFEDMQGSNDIREHWHSLARETLEKISERE